MKDKDRLFMDIAERVAEQSRCISLHVGAVLVNDDRIISIGYNGTPSGYPNCDEEYSAGRYTREGHHEWSIQHEIHAEMNTLLFAAKSGIPTQGCTLYVTHEPCDNCLKNCIAAGISRVIYRHRYQPMRPEWGNCLDFRDGSLIDVVQFEDDHTETNK